MQIIKQINERNQWTSSMDIKENKKEYWFKSNKLKTK
jgi:hypothetical protein